jgi:hypothetical protein
MLCGRSARCDLLPALGREQVFHVEVSSRSPLRAGDVTQSRCDQHQR